MTKLLLAAGVLLLVLLIILIVRRKRSAKLAGLNNKHQSHSPEIQAKANEAEETPPLQVAAKQEAVQETVMDLAIEQTATLENVTPVAPQTHNLTPEPPIFAEHIPQDSMLRRHYLAHLRCQIESLKPPRPSDSSLARHYDSLMAAELEACITDKSAIGQLQDRYVAYSKSLLASHIQQASPIIEPEIEPAAEMVLSLTPELDLSLEPDLVLDPETEPASDMALELAPEANDSLPATEPDKIIANQAPTGLTLPEDATLRRHTLSHIHALVESSLPQRPTDSVLRRHHDHLVEAEIQKRLGGKS